ALLAWVMIAAVRCVMGKRSS
ncbi:CrcB family protein, partial [Xanthomonas citri pv. citri]|nr:CrcB family protein [Xanthomonas citri pv. citri]